MKPPKTSFKDILQRNPPKTSPKSPRDFLCVKLEYCTKNLLTMLQNLIFEMKVETDT